MKKPKIPCNKKGKDCPERAWDCHGRCDGWEDYEEAKKEYNAAIQYEKNKDYGQTEVRSGNESIYIGSNYRQSRL